MSDTANNGGATGKGFKKGQSGNPNGRPKVPDSLRETARNLCPEVIKVWTEIMRGNGKDSDRIKASENIYFLSYGKFEQQIHADVDANVNATISIGVPDFVCEDDGK